MKKRLATTILVASSIALGMPAASAQELLPPGEGTRAPPKGIDRLEEMWRFELGYRGNFVTDGGYNPFATQDYFAQSSLVASRTIFARGRFSFAPGIAWDYGKTTATARGDATSLEMHRIAVPLEGRLHFRGWGYAFVRAAPGIAIENAEVDDVTAPCAQPASQEPCAAPLTKSRWLFATDVSAGYAYPVWSRKEVSDVVPRIWLQADGGYGWVVGQRLNLAADLAAGDARLASGIDLGALTMRGAFFRASAAVSF
jgi:hypothetical protein